MLLNFLVVWPIYLEAAPPDSAKILTAKEPEIHFNFLWLAAQAIPSPQWSFRNDGGSDFSLRWQITPVLYSFGINRKLSPWRYFIAEPFVRQSGSIELYLSPEWYNLNEENLSKWLWRAGARGYIPLYQRGEYWSASVGVSYWDFQNKQGWTYEVGTYVIYGILGLQVSYSPTLEESPWMLTLRLKYF